ncbi:MAG: EI24 domain-containing protein [Rhodobacter sp.]|nr:EI24 domain-containing protein [Rhodobacter sp.]
MIFGDFLKALGQTGDPRFRRVLFLGLGLTIALLFAVYAVFLGVVNWLAPDTVTLPILGEVTWVDDLLSGASILLMIFLSVFLMVPVASAFTGIFLEDVAQAVEDRHYPNLPPVPRLPFTESLTDSLNFLAVIVVANLLALVLYVFFVPAAPFIFWGLNGYLLGREYFQLVAMRRIGRKDAKAAFRRNVAAVWLAGLLMAIPLSVPILNLIIPILGAATFTHLFHRLERI